MRKKEGQRNEHGVISFLPNGEYCYEKGLKAYHSNDLMRAVKYLRRAVHLEPNNLDYMCQLAAVFAELEDYQASNDLLRMVVEQSGSDISECYFFMANNYIHLGLIDEAYEQAGNYIEADPNGEFIEEAKELREMVRVDLTKVSQTKEYDKAVQLVETEKNKTAIQLLQKFIAENQTHWDAYNDLACAYFYEEDVKKAFKTLEKVLEKDHGNLNAWCNAATFYNDLGETERCQKIINRLMQVYPISLKHRLKLGKTFMVVEEYEGAYRWLKTLEKQNALPDNDCYYWLIMASISTGRTEEALRAWEKIDVSERNLEHPLTFQYVKSVLLDDYSRLEPLIASLLARTIEKGGTYEKCFTLFAIRHLGVQGIPEKDEIFKTFSQKMGESWILKSIAHLMLLEAEGKPLESTVQEQQLLNGYRIFLKLQNELNEGRPLVEDYTFYWKWFEIFERGDRTNMTFHNINAWAAALEYVWRKLYDKVATQKMVANRYNVSSSTVGKYVHALKQLR